MHNWEALKLTPTTLPLLIGVLPKLAPPQGYGFNVPISLHMIGTAKSNNAQARSFFSETRRGTWHAVTAVGHLIRSGLRVPGDVSVISRDFVPFLRAQVPDIASYEVSHDLYASRLSRMVVELARTGTLPPTAKWIMPHFREGETIAKPAA